MPLPEPAPIVTTRLTLRAVTAGDLPELLQINGDDAVTRHLPYDSWRSLEDGHAWLQRMQALQATGAAQQRVVQRRADGRVIGTLLLFRHDEASARLEIGYVIGRAHWRQGYAREAVAAACQHACGSLGVRRIEAEVNPDNTASAGLLRGLGFVQEGHLRQRWTAKGRSYDTLLFGCLADEWHAPAPGTAGTRPEDPVQRQLDAYNACDLEGFIAQYSDDVEVFRPPAAAPVLRGRAEMAAHYASKRFTLSGLHATLLNRMVVGTRVVDHERIVGIAPDPVQAIAVYEVEGALIRRVWFY